MPVNRDYIELHKQETPASLVCIIFLETQNPLRATPADKLVMGLECLTGFCHAASATVYHSSQRSQILAISCQF